ncbi:MAG: phage major capsid protein [Blautia faecis]
MPSKYYKQSGCRGNHPRAGCIQYFRDAPKNSVFMGMARKLPNMTSNQTRIRVLDFLPTAYWVDGDTGMKQTTRQAWDNVYLNAGELAVIVPIPDAVLSDSEFDIFGEITPRVMEAIGQKVDAAVIFGDNRRENGRQTLLPWQDRLETMSHRQQEKIITILSLARMEYLRKLKMMATEFLELLHL